MRRSKRGSSNSSLLYSVLVYFCRSYLTNYERAIGIGKSQGASPARKKRKKRKPDADEERCTGVAKAADITSRTSSVCDYETTFHETGHRPCRDSSLRRSRGWFSSSWPQSNDTSQRSLSNVDQSLVRVVEALTQRTNLQLAELRFECSSAAKWSELKRSQRKDSDALLSSPAGVLWKGNVKPLIQPSQATSVGKLHFHASAQWPEAY